MRKGLIEKIAPFGELKSALSPEALGRIQILDCSDCIAIPGFVDSHTHLVFYGSRENELYMRASGKSYMNIMKQGGGIHATVKAVRNASRDQLIQKGLQFLYRALASGTTTLEIKSGYGLDMRNEQKMLDVIDDLNALHPIDIIPTFLVHAVPEKTNRKTYIAEVRNEMIPRFRECAEWFDIFVEDGVFTLKEAERLIRKAQDSGYFIGMHTNQIRDIGGEKLACDLGVRHVDHLEVLNDRDARCIMKNDFLYSVFLPTSEAFVFSGRTGQIQKLLEAPERIVLSTDFNPGSSPVLNPLEAITHALIRYRIDEPFLLIDAFTSNPARMLFLEDRGILKEGKKADIICLKLENFAQIPYYGTIPFIKYVIKDGKRVV